MSIPTAPPRHLWHRSRAGFCTRVTAWARVASRAGDGLAERRSGPDRPHELGDVEHGGRGRDTGEITAEPWPDMQ